MPASAADVIRVAFEHTKEQLLKPFRLGQWTRLAVTGILAGELSGGGCTFQSPGRGHDGSQTFLAQGIPPVNMLLVILIACLALLGLMLIIALVYVSSMMRFVLFDSVVTRECHIRRFWNRRLQPGFRYFVWQLVFVLSVVGILVILAGTAAVLVFGFRWYRNPGQHLVPLILGGLLFLIVFASFLVLAVLVHVLTKDFVVPQMALEDISAMEGWRRLWPMMDAERTGYAAYVGLKILLRLGAMVALAIAIVIALLALLVPIGVVGGVAFLTARAIGLAWNVFTIAATVVAGGVTLVAILYILLLMTVPLTVFFPAYSIYFFASRYPALNKALHPEASQ